MKTVIEGDRNGKPVRVFHRTGVRGAVAWTHPVSERAKCEACTKGTMPAAVKSARRVRR